MLSNQSLVQALVQGAVYSYLWDTITDEVHQWNTQKGEEELIQRLSAYEMEREEIRSRYAAGEQNFEQVFFVPAYGTYYRFSYYFWMDETDGHFKVFLICKKSPAEDALKKQISERGKVYNEAFGALYSMLKAGLFVCSFPGDGQEKPKIRYENEVRRICGFEDEKDFPNVWTSWIERVLPEDQAYAEGRFFNALNDFTGNTTFDVTFRFRKKDDTVIWLRAVAYFIRREDGTPLTCYGIVLDVDAREKSADAIRDALYQAKQANAAKTEFLSRMSHDIRTPMNAIIGLLELNDKHADNAKLIAENRKKAKASADYLMTILNDALQLSKLDDTRIELTDEPFHAVELCRDVISVVTMRAKEHGISLEYERDGNPTPYPYIYGSPLHVRQIFINVLDNAIRFNKPNGHILCKAGFVKCEGETVTYRIVISDTGIGISEAFLPHIYEPFSQEKSDARSTYRGTGLGLSIVKQLVDRMNGTIEVESKKGEGTTVTITVPFRMAREEDMPQKNMSMDAIDISGARILLVEDNELNMEIGEMMLTDAGAVVTKAVNGLEALTLMKEKEDYSFDLILMDIMMPVMDGLTATREIRKLDKEDAATIPIIAMSANAFAEDRKASLAAGMNGHINKPIKMNELLERLAEILQ